MKKTYLIPETMAMDVTSQQMMAQSPVQIVDDDDTPAVSTGKDDGDALVKGQGIWDNEW